VLIPGIIMIIVAAVWITWATTRHEGPAVRNAFELFWLGFHFTLALAVGLSGAVLACLGALQ
jgi:hypothetical protein